MNLMFSTIFFVTARHHLPTKPLAWNEVANPSISLAKRAQNNFEIDSKITEILNAREKFISSSQCNVSEIVANDLLGPALAEFEAHRRQCHELISLKFNELHRQKNALFGRRSDAQAAAVGQRALLEGLRAIRFPPRPEIPWAEQVTCEELEKLLCPSGPSAKQIRDGDFEKRVSEFDAQIKGVESTRDILTPQEWVSLGATIFFNSCSIAGRADCHGRATNDPEIEEFCEAVGIENANEAYSKFWFKPSSLPRHDLFESH